MSISARASAGEYSTLEDIVSDVDGAVATAIRDLRKQFADENADSAQIAASIKQLNKFKTNASEMLLRERAYPKSKGEALDGAADPLRAQGNDGDFVLSITGFAPQERRLFSSLPLSAGTSAVLEHSGLPPGVSITKVLPSKTAAKAHTLGEVFGSLRTSTPLQPPKQPKTQAKGNTLDFYHPQIADIQHSRGNNYFTTKLASGYYLDYSNATPSSQTVPKQRERAESLAGKKPSLEELASLEVDSLFRGAFSSFAPTKDDSSAVVSSTAAGRVWWQKGGLKGFQKMVAAEFGDNDDDAAKAVKVEEVDEAAIKEAIESWDDMVDPTLEDAMGSKRAENSDADGLLDEVSDMIETLASYQRIRNLTLPSSQNRPSGDPVNTDMLTNDAPQPSEEEQVAYEVLKAQLALIIKTLPPYAVAKLNGDQLDDLLISSRIEVYTDDYNGVMEEDEAGVQARIRAQQAAVQASPRATPQRPPAGGQFANQYQAPGQYGTPGRTPAHQQQYYRQQPNAAFQQHRNFTAPTPQRPPQPNQYTRQANGFQNQFATQLAKAQTPYGHQNMQQRPSQFVPQQGAPNQRFQFQPGYQQPAGTPTPVGYGGFPNGSTPQQRSMAGQMTPGQPQSPSPNMAQNRFPPGQGPGLTGYHTVISEAQQQRILEQAKARVAGGMGQPGYPMNAMRPGMPPQGKPQTPTGYPQGANGNPGTPPIPTKVTPVPLPVPFGTVPPKQ